MAKWDAGRFFDTISYFDAIPVFSDVKRWLTGGASSQASTSGERTLGLVLVVGGMGEIGQLIIAQLLKAGYKVRAIVSDLDSVPFNIPANLEFVRAELDKLTPELMQGIQSIIYAPDAQQLLTPTVVNNLAIAAGGELTSQTSYQIFDFTKPTSDLRDSWGAVDDVVMGGISKSGIQLGTGFAIFSGDVSTENSGGFASVRTRNFEPSLNLSNYQGIELRVKGDGQRYKLFLRTESKWDGVGYARSFDTSDLEWTTIRIPFAELVPIFRAKTVENASPIDSDQIRSIQLMLSKFEYDRELNPRFTPGRFSLEIESISAYGGKTIPQLIGVEAGLVSPELVATFQATNLPYTIVRSSNLDPKMVAMICVKAIAQPEAVGQILGH